MRLAHLTGLNFAPVKMVKASHKDVLLIERFDQMHSTKGWQRRAIVSALTILEIDEMMAQYASYEKLAEIIRHRFKAPTDTLHELYARMVFNILCGNTDDHARNHAAFWDGISLTLTPAYKIHRKSLKEVFDTHSPGFVQEVQDLFNSWWQQIQYNAYVGCFSEHDSLNENTLGRLSMWRA